MEKIIEIPWQKKSGVAEEDFFMKNILKYLKKQAYFLIIVALIWNLIPRRVC
jgi:hypothetical protein